MKLAVGKKAKAVTPTATIEGEITIISTHPQTGKIVAVFIDDIYVNPKHIVKKGGNGRPATGNGRRTIYTDLKLMDELAAAMPGTRDSWITKTIREAAINQKLIADKQLNSI